MTKPMPAKTIEAMKASISKWEKIVAGIGDDRGMKNCPLCQIFVMSGDVDQRDCRGCPVSERAGARYCIATPYAAWIEARHSGDVGRSDTGGFIPITNHGRTLARAELDFLRSLLPPEATA